jgi:hypothetical protein
MKQETLDLAINLSRSIQSISLLEKSFNDYESIKISSSSVNGIDIPEPLWIDLRDFLKTKKIEYKNKIVEL